MKFYSDEKKVIVWDAENERVLCIFKNGEFETEDQRIIGLLSEKYRSDDDGWKTEQGNTERQETEEEQAVEQGESYFDWGYEELRAEAKRLKVKNYSRMKREALAEALSERGE